MAKRLRSAIETLFSVRDETNALAPSADERRRQRNEFVEVLRSYGVPIMLLLVGAAVIAAAIHFLVWSVTTHILMPLIYAGVPGLASITVGASVLPLGTFIGYMLYTAGMVGMATLGVRTVLAKPRGYVRERTKTCPACAMTVLDVANKCRFCGTAIPAHRSYGNRPPSGSRPHSGSRPPSGSRSPSGSRPPSGSRDGGPTLSSTRTRSDDEDADRPPRRSRRGGRRRGGRGGSGSGPGSGTSSSSTPSGDRPPRSETGPRSDTGS